jgi:glycosyltransferase involved in cell wall biosynthesis
MIGVLTTSYPLDGNEMRGGFVAGLANFLAANYGDVEVLCAEQRSPFSDGGAPAALAGANPSAWFGGARFSARLFTAAMRRRRAWRALVSHWLVPCGAVGAVVAGARPHLAIAHGGDVRLLDGGVPGRAVMRAVAARSELVYVNDRLRVPGIAARVAPMGVDGAALSGGNREARRHGLGDAMVLLFLGRLVREKGCDVLAAALDPPLDGVLAIVAGDGPERAALERCAPPSLRFVGALDAHERRQWLAAADVLVQPSRADGAPLAVAEAQLAGLPVIASQAGAAHVADGVDGLVVQTNSPPALRAAIVRLRDDLAMRRRLAAAAAENGLRHDWSVAGPRLIGNAFASLPRGVGKIFVTAL